MGKQKVNRDSVQAQVAKTGYPEVGSFKEQKELQRFYKHLDIPQLEEWVKLEGLEVNPTDSEPIYRMRLCMSVLYLHFPKEPSKKTSKYSGYKLEDLVGMAAEHDVPVEICEDERILRMRVIMALRAHKIID